MPRDVHTIVVHKLGGSLLDLPDLPRRLARLFAARPTTRPLLIVGGGPTADLIRAWDKIHRLGDDSAHCLALEAMRLNEALVHSLLPQATLVSTRAEADEVWEDRRRPILRAAEFLAAEEASIQSDRATSQTVTSETKRHGVISMRELASDAFAGDAKTGRRARPVHPDHPLPRTWDVTSDSIAAWIALRWPADELVLLKSTSPSESPESDRKRGPRGDLPPIAPSPIALPQRNSEIESTWEFESEPNRNSLVDPCFGALASRIARVSIVNLRDARWRDAP